jgi:sugar O-acyltransferase (sialic acid O-acetyltransferase NeuD family)
MNKKPIAVYGAGGLGREVLALIKALPEWDAIGFFDDGIAMHTSVNEIPVLGSIQELITWKTELAIVLAIGNPLVKKKIGEQLSSCSHLSFPVLIHPLALIMDRERVTLGEGAILTAGCVLTTDITIGKHVLINLNATVGHDCKVGDFCSLMPGTNLAGVVTIEEASLIGSGANLLTGLVVGKHAIVGAGAVVTKSVPASDVVAGVPAQSIKTK